MRTGLRERHHLPRKNPSTVRRVLLAVAAGRGAIGRGCATTRPGLKAEAREEV
jgi:hypothetical protein